MNAIRGAILAAAAMCMHASAVRAETIYDFTYVSTRDNANNNAAHLLNTGVRVVPGDILHIVGTGQIHVGGPYYVMSNFDMGLISPANTSQLIRSYRGVGGNFSAEPIPLAGESVFFRQDRANLYDDHDLDIVATAQSEGYLYIGIFDNWFADNTGQHSLRITILPEPASGLLAVIGSLALLGRRRGRSAGR